MKHVYKIYLFLSLCVLGQAAQPLILTGDLMSSVEENNRSDYKVIRYCANIQSYKKGGIKFTYPEGYFTSKPYVNVTLERNKVAYNDYTKLTWLVVENTNTSITVQVNKEVVGYLKNSIEQASDDDVYVHFFVVGS